MTEGVQRAEGAVTVEETAEGGVAGATGGEAMAGGMVGATVVGAMVEVMAGEMEEGEVGWMGAHTLSSHR